MRKSSSNLNALDLGKTPKIAQQSQKRLIVQVYDTLEHERNRLDEIKQRINETVQESKESKQMPHLKPAETFDTANAYQLAPIKPNLSQRKLSGASRYSMNKSQSGVDILKSQTNLPELDQI